MGIRLPKGSLGFCYRILEVSYFDVQQYQDKYRNNVDDMLITRYAYRGLRQQLREVVCGLAL